MKRRFLLLTVLSFFLAFNVEGQSWLLGGNVNIGPDGLTSTPGNNQLGSTLNTDILFIQNNTERVLLTNGTYSDPVLGNQNVTRLGYSIQDGVSTPITNPFSIHHLGEQTSSVFQRTWFNVGTTYGINTDLMYVGLKKNPEDDGTEERTDAVIAWGDNSVGSQTGPDVLRFIRLQDVQSGSSTPSHTDEGQEVGRFLPNGNFGVGNFSSNGLGLNDPPTQKLDVDGAARFRQLPIVSPDALILGYQENPLDENDLSLTRLELNGNQEDYLAGDGSWQTLLNNAACDWDLITNGASDDLVMGFAGACNEGNVGIGTSNPDAQLNIVTTVNGSGDNTAEHIEIDGGGIMQGIRIDANASQSTADLFGIQVESNGITSSTGDHAGLRVRCSNGNRVYGVRADVGYVDQFQFGFGVYGRADLGAGQRGIGIYGEGNFYAGYFSGALISGAAALSSDEMFKQDIFDLENALGIVSQLNPKTYSFKQDEFPEMNFQEGTACGLIAQEVQDVFPMAVMEAQHPPSYNEDGELIKEAYDYLAVKYSDFIPLLIKSTQEQQQIIDAKSGQINELESTVQLLQTENSALSESIETLNENVQMLAELIQSCCSIDVELKSNEQGPNIQLLQNGNPVNELEQNFPNPFESQTTISYTVACNCLATIKIIDQTGQTIEVLVSETKEAGNYQVNWDASDLSAGMYYYSLEVDGQELVRKAIKL